MKGIKIFSLIAIYIVLTQTLCSQVSGVSPSSWIFQYNGGSTTFSLYSSSYWGIGSPSWISCSPSYGSGNATITITCQPNNTGSARTATLDVGGKSFVVTQGAPFPPPTPTISSTITKHNGSSTIRWQGTPPSGVSWYWQTSSSGENKEYGGSSYTVYGVGNYTCYLRAYNNSTHLWSTSSASISVPVISCNPPGGSSSVSVCYNNSKKLQAASAPGETNVTSHKWYKSDGSLINDYYIEEENTQPYATSYTTTFTGNTTLYVSAVCDNSVESNKKQINVSVNSPVTPHVSISSEPAAGGGPGGMILSICQGDEVTLTANPLNGGNNPAYIWRNESGAQVGTGETYTSTSMVNGDEFTVHLTSSAECLTNNNPNAESLPINLDVKNKLYPYVTISAIPGSSIERGDYIRFIAEPHDVSGATVGYQWYLNEQAIGTNSSEFVSNTLSDKDKVKCEISVSGAECINNTSAISEPIVVTVKTIPLLTPAIRYATNVTITSFRANWYSVLGANNYLLYVSTSKSFSSYVDGYNGKAVSETMCDVTGLSGNTTYYYRVKALGVKGDSDYSSSAVVTTKYPITGDDVAVGSIPGNASVNGIGGASYSIPIEIPAGIQSIQPNLGVVFSSHGGNGLLGQGFNLSGISAIVRVPNNPYYDGDYHAVDLTGQDKYALDGQRLLVTSGLYGNGGSTYTTENDPTTRVTCTGFGINDPFYFTVETKNGIKMTYGNTETSKVEPPGSAHGYMWLINRMEDANGNFMTYNYSIIDGETLINTIEYTGNGSQVPFYTVKFNYIDRMDKGFAYVNGLKMEAKHLLKNIEIRYGDELLKRYRFSYETDIVSRLTSIALENADGEQINPNLFEWEKKRATMLSNHTIEGIGGVIADFNGDGLSDLYALVKEDDLYYERYFQNYGGTLPENYTHSNQIEESWEVFDGILDIDGNGKLDVLKIKDVADAHEIMITRNAYTSFHIDYSDFISDSGDEKFIKATTGDFNGDGQDEVLLFTRSGKIFLYAYDRSISNFTKTEIIQNVFPTPEDFDKCYKLETGDYNGDGKVDIGYVYDNSIFYTKTFDGTYLRKIYNFNSLLPGLKTKIGDFNTDGIADVARTEAHAFTINFINPNSGSAESVVSTPPIPTKEYGAEFKPEHIVCDEGTGYFTSQVQDVNADGRADIVYCLRRDYTFRRNDYAEWEDEDLDFLYGRMTGIIINASNATWNSGYQTFIAYGRGNGEFIFSNRIFSNANDISSSKLMFGDVNGDGMVDIFRKYLDSHFYLLSGNFDYQAYQLKKVTDGLNNTVEFNYKTLNNPEEPIYTRSEFVDFPLRDAISSLSVVESITRSNGSCDDIVEKYSYEYGRIHLRGRGFLGFQRTRVENLTTKVTINSFTSFSNDYYVPEHTWTETNINSNGVKHHNKYGTFVPLGGKRYRYVLDEERFWDVLAGTITYTNYTYDDYNNVLSSTTTINEWDDIVAGNPTPGAPVTTTVYSPYIAKGAWCPNRTESATVTYTREGTDPISRTINYTWDDNGNPTMETKDPGDVNSLVTSYPAYDNFGNPEEVVVTANGKSRNKTFTFENGRMLKTVTNHLGQTTTYTNDLKWSKVTNSLDFKNREIIYSYDAWGQKTSTETPDGIIENIELKWVDDNGPQGAVFYSEKTVTGLSPEKVWFDETGRKLRSEAIGFNGQTVYVDYQYDASGREENVSDPYYSDENDDPLYTSTEYDDYGRVAKKTLSTGDVIETSYGEKSLTVTGPNTDITKTKNSLGEIITSIDNKSGQSVSYEYYADGNVKSATPSTGPAITMEYDLQGNRTKLTDLDAGVITYKYNGFGDMLWQEDNKMNRTTNNYNDLSLLDNVTRTGAETITYSYDNDYRLSGVSTPSHTVAYVYDELDRVTTTTETVGSEVFVSEVSYDDLGRVEKETYPSGYYINNVYDDYGMLTEIVDQNNTSIWKLDDMSALGQINSVTKGNGVSTVYTYDAHHRPKTVKATGIIDFEYEFDPVTANLNYRMDNIHNLREDFTYDDLNRLTGAKILGQANNYLDLTYEANGNITSKSDAATLYSYDAVNKPHAVKGLENPMNIPSIEQTINYTSFNKVDEITEGDYQLKFTYGADNLRRKTEYYEVGALVKTKYFIGNYEVEVDASNQQRKIHYIAGGDEMAAVYIEEPGAVSGNGDIYYTYTDYLGSLVAVQDENGSIQRQNFDPWGRRRNVEDWDDYENISTFDILDRGYTGHQHLYAFGLINMNGRLYDPVLARMLSPDPQLQAPDFAQNFNRYSYAWNNPLRFTDPDGEFVWVPILIGAYIGGAIAEGTGGLEGANWNPFGGSKGSWAWDSNTWKGIGVGAFYGASLYGGIAGGSKALLHAAMNMTGKIIMDANNDEILIAGLKGLLQGAAKSLLKWDPKKLGGYLLKRNITHNLDWAVGEDDFKLHLGLVSYNVNKDEFQTIVHGDNSNPDTWLQRLGMVYETAGMLTYLPNKNPDITIDVLAKRSKFSGKGILSCWTYEYYLRETKIGEFPFKAIKKFSKNYKYLHWLYHENVVISEFINGEINRPVRERIGDAVKDLVKGIFKGKIMWPWNMPIPR